MCDVDEDELADLTTRAEKLGLEIFCGRTCGYVLRRIGHATTNPAAHSIANLAALREMLDDIESGRALGARCRVSKRWVIDLHASQRQKLPAVFR
jgi:hypothetical protein